MSHSNGGPGKQPHESRPPRMRPARRVKGPQVSRPIGTPSSTRRLRLHWHWAGPSAVTLSSPGQEPAPTLPRESEGPTVDTVHLYMCVDCQYYLREIGTIFY